MSISDIPDNNTDASHLAPIVIAAGGTGGHVFPALALAQSVLAQGCSVMMITEQRGSAYLGALADKSQVQVVSLRVRRPQKKWHFPLTFIRFIWDLVHSVMHALRIFAMRKPKAVAAFGGYPVVPALIAASILRIPIVIHEQNAWLGRTNRWLACLARRVALSFHPTVNVPNWLRPRSVVTGLPVRAAFGRPFTPYEVVAARSDIRIFVMGGSQGAHIFRVAIPAAVATLPDDMRQRILVVQQCRPEDLLTTQEAYDREKIKCKLQAFFDDVPDQLDQSTLVISRAGASTLTELTIAQRPAILIPYPHAMENHQMINAQALAKHRAAWVVAESHGMHERLAFCLKSVLSHANDRVSAAKALGKLARPHALSHLTKLVLE